MPLGCFVVIFAAKSDWNRPFCPVVKPGAGFYRNFVQNTLAESARIFTMPKPGLSTYPDFSRPLLNYWWPEAKNPGFWTTLIRTSDRMGNKLNHALGMILNIILNISGHLSRNISPRNVCRFFTKLLIFDQIFDVCWAQVEFEKKNSKMVFEQKMCFRILSGS